MVGGGSVRGLALRSSGEKVRPTRLCWELLAELLRLSHSVLFSSALVLTSRGRCPLVWPSPNDCARRDEGEEGRVCEVRQMHSESRSSSRRF